MWRAHLALMGVVLVLFCAPSDSFSATFVPAFGRRSFLTTVDPFLCVPGYLCQGAILSPRSRGHTGFAYPCLSDPVEYGFARICFLFAHDTCVILSLTRLRRRITSEEPMQEARQRVCRSSLTGAGRFP